MFQKNIYRSFDGVLTLGILATVKESTELRQRLDVWSGLGER